MTEVCLHLTLLHTYADLFSERYSSDDSDSDSDSDYRRSRAVARQNTDRRLKIVPCSEECADHPHKASSRSKSRSRQDDSDSDYDSVEEARKLRINKNRKLLYTGLAGVTTIGCVNGIYQSTKAYRSRHKEMQEGEKCSAEVQRLKNKAILMDLFTLGVCAVGLNNVRIGWGRVDVIEKEGKALRDRRGS